MTGSVALIQQYLPRATESTALRILEHGAEVDSSLGEARVDAYQALVYLLKEYLPIASA